MQFNAKLTPPSGCWAEPLPTLSLAFGVYATLCFTPTWCSVPPAMRAFGGTLSAAAGTPTECTPSGCPRRFPANDQRGSRDPDLCPPSFLIFIHNRIRQPAVVFPPEDAIRWHRQHITLFLRFFTCPNRVGQRPPCCISRSIFIHHCKGTPNLTVCKYHMYSTSHICFGFAQEVHTPLLARGPLFLVAPGKIFKHEPPELNASVRVAVIHLRGFTICYYFVSTVSPAKF